MELLLHGETLGLSCTRRDDPRAVEHRDIGHGSAPAEHSDSPENSGWSSVLGYHQLTMLRSDLVKVSGSVRHSAVVVEAELGYNSAWERHCAAVV